MVVQPATSPRARRAARSAATTGRTGVVHHGCVRTAWGQTWVRAALLHHVLAAGAVVALTVDLPGVASVRGWLDSTGAAGPVLLALALGAVLLAPVPRTALSVLAGVVAGFWTGLAVALGGALIGGLAGFALSRWLGRDAAARLAGPRLEKVDRLVGERGFVSVLGGRLIPVVPFTLLSYAAGLTGVRLAPYLAATAVGLLPSTVVQVGLGASAPFALAHATAFAAVPGAVVVALAAVGLIVRRRRRRSADAAGLSAAG